MKLKIYVFKKKQLIWTAIILGIIVVSAILVISIKTTQTINFLTLPNSYKADINSDGKVDTVIAKVDDKTNKYSINVICSDENGYVLEPDPVIKCFGVAKGKAPINITFKDINGDGKEEIFIQSTDDHGPILHIFKYTNHKIERIVSGRYSMYGLVNNPNTQSNMLVLMSDQNNKVKLTYLKSDSDSLTPCINDNSLGLSTNTIASVVNLIEKKDVETVNLNIDSVLKSKLITGAFVDGIINDVEYSNSDFPAKCTYLLRTASQISGKQQFSTYKVHLALDDSNTSSPSYAVTDIEKSN